MPWFKVDDNLAFHQKSLRAGNAAMGLWVRAGSWCAQQLTDGFIPTDIARTLGTKSEATRLVNANLWLEREGGYEFWQWAEDGRQPTRAEVEEKRKATRERQRRAREKAAAVTPSVTRDEEAEDELMSSADAAEDALISQTQGPDQDSLSSTTPVQTGASIRSTKPQNKGTQRPSHSVVTRDTTRDIQRDSRSDDAVSHGSPDPTRPDPVTTEDQDLGGERRETLRPADATKPPPGQRPPIGAQTPADARCTKHHGVPDPGPCNGCRAARETAETRANRAAEQSARTAEAAARACTRCDGAWIVDPKTALPTRQKCDHRRTA